MHARSGEARANGARKKRRSEGERGFEKKREDVFHDLIAFRARVVYNSRMKINPDLTHCRNKRVCVAFSGGGDSIALLHCLRECATENGIELSAVNIEHGIRGERSREDSAFAAEVCARWGIPLYAFREDVPARSREWGKGIEEAAREVRYAIFERLLREGAADVVATAHHALDNAESVLFNLLRGCSLSGAGGIRAFIPLKGQNGAEKGIARPFLGVSKDCIESYLKENGLAWREDESNADASYTRNFLRLEILPRLKERFCGAEQALYRFSRTAREDDEYLSALAEDYFTEGDVCFIEENAPKPLFFRCIVRALRHFGVEKDYTVANLEDVYALREGENGKTICLPQGVFAAREYGKISVYRQRAADASEPAFGEGKVVFGGKVIEIVRGKAAGGLYFDADKLPQGCVIRTRREGDVFAKFGSGKKKLKEFLIDRKIPVRERAEIPVIAKGKEVYVVCGVEISEKIKADSDTVRFFTVTTKEKGE